MPSSKVVGTHKMTEKPLAGFDHQQKQAVSH